MSPIRLCLGALLIAASPLAAQTAKQDAPAGASAARQAEEDRPFPVQFGVAGGALSYEGGRKEQALGAVLRWAAVPWLSFSATPTMVRVQEPTTTVGPIPGRTGVVDLPVEATAEHTFEAPWSPGLALAMGVSLPLGDTATGFGAGKVGYSASAGFGFSPAERVWVHLGAGRSIGDVLMQSAFSGANGWADASAGVSVTERFGLSAGYGTDLGSVDSTIGHSRSITGGIAYVIHGANTFNLNASRGVSGVAPRWSIAIGMGTAFPYLTHVGAGSPVQGLQNTFGGGSHGLPGGAGTGTGTGGSSGGRGRGRGAL